MIQRKTPIKRLGKKTLEWIKARDRLTKIYHNKDIVICEVKLTGCWYDNALNFAHKFKRSDPRCRHTFKQTLLACNPCHSKIEIDSDLTEYYFKKLRP